MINDLIAWQAKHKLGAKQAASILGYTSRASVDSKRTGRSPITNQDRIIMASYDKDQENG